MKTEVRPDALNFVNSRLIAAAMDLDTRAFAEKPASRSIFLPIFALF
jgi:hypothetical protein